MARGRIDEEERRRVRAQILAAARELFVDQGFANVSMRRIGERINLAATTIYLYFSSGKREIFECLIDEYVEKLQALFLRIRDAGDPPRETIEKFLRGYVRLGIENPALYRITFLLPADIWPTPEDHMPAGSSNRSLYDGFLELLRACVPEDEHDRHDLEINAQAMWASVHGFVALWNTYPTFPWKARRKLEACVIEAAMANVPGV